MIVLGIGSNLKSNFGNRFMNIDIAISYLEQYGIKLLKKSSYYESLSYPDSSKPKFINVIIEVSTSLPPEDLASVLIYIEEKLERKRSQKNEPRTCDIDIIDYKQMIVKNKIILPHSRMHIRNFVLLPLFEITKTWIHPLKKVTIKDLVNSLKTEELRAIKLI